MTCFISIEETVIETSLPLTRAKKPDFPNTVFNLLPLPRAKNGLSHRSHQNNIK